MHDLQFEQTWNLLKAKGLYPQFKTYQEYKESQKAKGIVDLNPKVGMMNPAAAQIKADARAFDETYGMGNEIDPKSIPF